MLLLLGGSGCEVDRPLDLIWDFTLTTTRDDAPDSTLEMISCIQVFIHRSFLPPFGGLPLPLLLVSQFMKSEMKGKH